MSGRPFPPGFLFGCATSAYQVEGGIENDWGAWERAGRLEVPGVSCGRATGHWERFEEDFERLRALGATAYRFSVEWARVEPEPGVFDEEALARYGRMVALLRRHGIEPFVTLLHFTHPPWFHTACPWHGEDGEAARRFLRFATRVLPALGGQVRYFTVLNEPMVWLEGAYLAGAIPPGDKGLGRMMSAARQLVSAHGLVARRLKEALGPEVRVGVANNVVRFAPSRPWWPGDQLAAAYAAHHHNHLFPLALTTGRLVFGRTPGLRRAFEIPEARGSLDFIGVNYYARLFVEAGLRPLLRGELMVPYYEDRGALGVSDLGWEIHPEGLTALLGELAGYGLPLYVTENGLDDRDDSRRSAYLHDHLGAVLDAVAGGADVRGYLFWSLLDNFEWLQGFAPRFGLFRVDYETLERAPTAAVAHYARIIREHRLPEERPPARVRPGWGRVPPV